MNSSRHAIKKKSFISTIWHSDNFWRAPSKSKLTYRCSMNSVIGSLYVYDSYKTKEKTGNYFLVIWNNYNEVSN